MKCPHYEREIYGANRLTEECRFKEHLTCCLKNPRNVEAESDIAYPLWRFNYWVTKKNMTYDEIDRAVESGKLNPGDIPVDGKDM